MTDGKKNVFWLGVTSLFQDISSEMIMALLPLFLVSLGATKMVVGVIEGVAQATASIFKVISGWVSDRIQKRKGLVAAGYAISLAVRPLIAVANTWYQVLGARFFDRIGKGIRNAPRDALIVDSVPAQERGRWFGFHRAMDTSGAIIGALLASAFLFVFSKYTDMPQIFQYRTIFWIAIIPGIMAVLTVSLLVKDVKRTEFVKKEKINFWGSVPRAFKVFLLVTAIFELSNFSYALFILRAADLGVIIALIPILYLTYNMVYASLSYPIGILSDNIGKKNVLLAGYILTGLMCFGFAFANASWQAWLLFMLFGVVSAVIDATPRAYIGDLAPKESRGTAFGAYHTLEGVVALPASAIAGLLWDVYSPLVAFSYGGILAIIAAVLFFIFIPAKRTG